MNPPTDPAPVAAPEPSAPVPASPVPADEDRPAHRPAPETDLADQDDLLLGATTGAPRPEPDAGTARSRARRRQIVRVAAHLFAERGYKGASLRDISRLVGISHPGMLHHFKTKDALLDAVVDDLEGHAQYSIDHLDAYTRGSSALEILVRRNHEEGAQRMLLFAVLSTEVVNPEHPARMRMIRLRRVYERIAERVLHEYEEQGALVPGTDIEWAARTIISLSIAHATREATIGAVQQSSSGLDLTDYLSLLRLLRR